MEAPPVAFHSLRNSQDQSLYYITEKTVILRASPEESPPK